jgi:hypothetical protein
MICPNCHRELAPDEGPYCTDMVGCEAERQGRLRLAEQVEAEREGIPLDDDDDPHPDRLAARHLE